MKVQNTAQVLLTYRNGLWLKESDSTLGIKTAVVTGRAKQLGQSTIVQWGSSFHIQPCLDLPEANLPLLTA